MKRAIVERSVAVLLLVCLLFSCVQTPVEPNKVTKQAMLTESAKKINKNLMGVLETVRTINGDQTYSDFIKDIDMGEVESYLSYSGEEIVRGLDSEEGGQDMLNFLYNIDSFGSTDEVLDSASIIIKDEEAFSILREVSADVEEQINEMATSYLSETKALTPSQKEAFYKDVKSMVIKSVVLLSAAVVYSVIPSNVFWGKVSAAAAFSIAAGVLAATLLNLIEYYKVDNSQKEKTFASWVEDLAVEPAKYWTVALGFLNTYKAMNISPLLGGILLAVFTIAGVADDVKPLLKNYNFKA